MQRKTLYSISALGAPRFWCIELDVNNARYRTFYGLCDLDQSTEDQPYPSGKVTSSNWRYAGAKNVGRSNEVSAKEQSMLEASRLITEKLKSGFYEYGTNRESKFEVMLAYTYKEDVCIKRLKAVKSKLVFFQPKLDGVRCYITLNGLEAKSRNNNNFPKIEDRLRELAAYVPQQYSSIILDGEIYQSGKAIGDIISAIRLGLNEDMKFYAFDAIDLQNLEMPYSKRLELLTNVVSAFNSVAGNFITQVETHVIDVPAFDIPNLPEYIAMHHDMYVPTYEGLIIRLNTPYKFGRSTGLMKYKNMITREFEVVSLIEGDGNSQGLAASAFVQLRYTEEDFELFPFLRAIKDPPLCGISVKGEESQKHEYLVNAHKYLSKYATVSFQSFIEPSGMLRFGELLAFRDYE